ncbi:MAG: Trk system potassium transporter TrkA [Rhodobacteraceae bacterium]|nr:Trk system potassium transporter TrkA [Paracoccaceae bacterium]
MKILVVGAGQVGVQVCKYLVREKDCEISILDKESDRVESISEKFNINGVVGEGNNKDDLMKANIQSTNLIVVATPSDDRNVMIAYFARKLNPQINTIARVRNRNYHDFIDRSRDGFVDVIINPEGAVADTAQRLIQSRQLIYYQDLFDGKSQIVGLKLTGSSNVLNTPLRQLSASFVELKTTVIAFRRNEILRLANSDDTLIDGDEVYLVTAKEDLERALEIFGIEQSHNLKLLVIGGGRVGGDFARILESRQIRPKINIIERKEERTRRLAEVLEKATVFHGDGMNREIIMEAGIQTSQTVVAFTENDHTNLLALFQAKQINPRVITVGLLNDNSLNQLASSMGIDIILNPQTTTISRVLVNVKPISFRQVYIVGQDEGELCEIEIRKSYHSLGKKIKDLKLPMLIAGILRDNQSIKFTPDTTIHEGDVLALFMLSKDVRKVTEFFGADGF